ncbi:RNA polymerase sigma factor [Streptomyces sp. wa1063]|uniref:RNA polymerase sigma factor n=1 Tax=Streptomyces sp. wa1063 TaxID=1828212 RepID=UPI000BF11166|nr:RNA polymerase sigma factor [Streptomyces sp. wa1063]
MDRIDAQPLTAASADRLDRLFRLYNRRLVAFAVTRTRDHATAEDVVSETWLRAALSLHQLQADDDRAYGWLRSIAFRAAVDQYRPRRASEQPRDWTDALASFSLPAAPPADADALAFAALTPRQAAVWKLKSQGLSDRRIALRLGRSETAIWKRKHAGARRLRSSMALAR